MSLLLWGYVAMMVLSGAMLLVGAGTPIVWAATIATAVTSFTVAASGRPHRRHS